MKKDMGQMIRRVVASAVMLCLVCAASGDTYYVDADGMNPVPPFADWATAATNIQDAIDLAQYSDTVLVTNGIYEIGGRPVAGYALTNRIVVGSGVIVRSVSGSSNTVIVGMGPLGDSAVRCAYLCSNAVLSGFTLTNGHTRTVWLTDHDSFAGGAFLEAGARMEDCAVIGNEARFYGGGASAEDAVISNCVFRKNHVTEDGGAIYKGTAVDCVFVENTADSDGGAVCAVGLYDCRLLSNTAYYGGAANASHMSNCVVMYNSATNGGAGNGCRFTGCLVRNNHASEDGGAMLFGTAIDSLIMGNSAGQYGGGAYCGMLTGCTVFDNTAEVGGGGMWGVETPNMWLRNCIVFNNHLTDGASNDIAGTYCLAEYTCGGTWVGVSGGDACITNDPGFADASAGDLQLAADSRCVNAGNSEFVSESVDLNGGARIRRGRVDMGAYESDFWGVYADIDGDGFEDWTEVNRTGTDPTNAASCLMIECVEWDAGRTGRVITWQSAAGKIYRLGRSTNMLTDAFSSNVATGVAATPPMNVFTDRMAVGTGTCTYRVQLEQ